MINQWEGLYFLKLLSIWINSRKGERFKMMRLIEGKHQPKQKQTQAKICKKEMVIYNEEGKILKT